MSSNTHEHHHTGSPSEYVKVLLALMFLMGLTIAVAYIPGPIGHWLHETRFGSIVSNALNLGIATVKATLVVMFFMGVKRASNLIKLWAIAGFIWFTTMFMMFADYGTRHFEEVQAFDTKDAGTAYQRTNDRERLKSYQIDEAPLKSRP
jgi:cytochrome c oxidase subunit 4